MEQLAIRMRKIKPDLSCLVFQFNSVDDIIAIISIYGRFFN